MPSRKFCAISGMLLVAAVASLAQEHPLVHERQAYALNGIGYNSSEHTLGNKYNYWTKYENGTFDLTRRDVVSVTAPKLVTFLGKRTSAIVEPSRTALVIIDMQNYFLHPLLQPNATTGRAAIAPTVAMIEAFRRHSVPVLWVNWGLTDYDLLTMPPVIKSGFSTNDTANLSFGSDMGVLEAGGVNGTDVEMGPKLMRGAWNAEPYGVLGEMKDAGLAAGTDLLFHKNRQSGLWGAQTPLGLWLEEQGVTTLFFGGVNADQCVFGTFNDAFYKGYDSIYVDDMSATTTPFYAIQAVRYNCNAHGFIGNSTEIIESLDKC